MKKYSLLLVALVCSMHHSYSLPTSSFWNEKELKRGLAYTLLAVGSFIAGDIYQKYTSNSKVEIALKKAAEKRSLQEKKEAAAIAEFHTIDNINKLVKEFLDIKARCPQPESSSDHVQQQIVKLMVSLAGSVTAFSNNVVHYLDAYNRFDKATSLAHTALHNDLLWLKRATNTSYAQNKKNQEQSETRAQAKEQAELDKKKYEAVAAKNLVEATAQVKQLAINAESTVYRTTKEVRDVSVSMRDEYRTHKATMNRKLAAISDAHARPGFEHKEILEGICDLKQQLHRVTAITNNTQKTTANITDNVATITKKYEDKIKQLQEELKKTKDDQQQKEDHITKLLQELSKLHKEIASLKFPSTPPVGQLYPPLYPQNPPAFNPGRRSEYNATSYASAS